MTWPIGEIDDVRRLRVLAAAIPGAMYVETDLPAPFDEVWQVLGDLEQALPGLVPDVRSVHVTQHHGERFRAMVRGRSGLRAPFDGILRPGWCLMQSRFVSFGIAVVPAGDGTRLGYMAGFRLPGMRILGPLLVPANRLLGRVVVRRFVTRFARHVDTGGPPM
ncbi:hypothetical protein GCM10023194_27950 [Planotetraspora phitsanulokensis]|uniref:Polyketide cyclase / dehydrase and lipid transport n=1 Tax=Planotetraspora phitsanulokensis TaxID=575192 RepID=A0A8J3TZX0_9ACTN|nr:hypothetical protein [Planotetraspora phitsanulokensis]GII36068.1 hypothetical protein Pph01_10710 [Planotetraspora phitsanulokensis]